MDLWKVMFGSPYDRAALVLTVVALAIHAGIDWSRRRKELPPE